MYFILGTKVRLPGDSAVDRLEGERPPEVNRLHEGECGPIAAAPRLATARLVAVRAVASGRDFSFCLSGRYTYARE